MVAKAANDELYTITKIEDTQAAAILAGLAADQDVNLLTAIAGEDFTNNVIAATDKGLWKQISATDNVATAPTVFRGFFVSSGTPTVTVYDNASADANIIVNAVVTVAGTMYRFPPLVTANGLRVKLTGVGEVTVFYGYEV